MPRILIIDDEENIRTLIVRILTNAGHEAVAAGDGREGMQLQRAAPADLIITDLMMPGQEGLETIGKIRRDFPQSKIIAMSGGGRHCAQDFLPLAQKLGASRTLPKPFTGEQLLEAVRAVLGA